MYENAEASRVRSYWLKLRDFKKDKYDDDRDGDWDDETNDEVNEYVNDDVHDYVIFYLRFRRIFWEPSGTLVFRFRVNRIFLCNW